MDMAMQGIQTERIERIQGYYAGIYIEGQN